MALVVKNLPADEGDIGDPSSNPVLGRSSGGGHGNPTLVFSPGESHGQRGAWHATVHRVTKSLIQLKRHSTHPSSAFHLANNSKIEVD